MGILCETSTGIVRMLHRNKMRINCLCEVATGIDNYLGSVFFKIAVWGFSDVLIQKKEQYLQM